MSMMLTGKRTSREEGDKEMRQTVGLPLCVSHPILFKGISLKNARTNAANRDNLRFIICV